MVASEWYFRWKTNQIPQNGIQMMQIKLNCMLITVKLIQARQMIRALYCRPNELKMSAIWIYISHKCAVYVYFHIIVGSYKEYVDRSQCRLSPPKALPFIWLHFYLRENCYNENLSHCIYLNRITSVMVTISLNRQHSGCLTTSRLSIAMTFGILVKWERCSFCHQINNKANTKSFHRSKISHDTKLSSFSNELFSRFEKGSRLSTRDSAREEESAAKQGGTGVKVRLITGEEMKRGATIQ